MNSNEPETDSDALGQSASVPRHIAVIMDGNGRWAQQQGLPRVAGHEAGARSVRRIVAECGRLNIDVLTLYSFSIENWNRPHAEISALMNLLLHHLAGERAELLANNVRLVHLGRRQGLDQAVLDALDETIEATRACDGLTLALAINYGARTELVDAVREIATQVEDGTLAPSEIDDDVIERHLYTAGLPDPDLLIRTAGEMRLSNYLLWQISYSELFVTPTLWPDFDEQSLADAINAYAKRERRFGALPDTSATNS